jgi:CheY-like chemotaxis protein
VITLPRGEIPASPVPSLDGTRVLLVENEDDSREAMALSLRSYGATVLTAASAAEARHILHHQQADVLLVDIGLPGEDGYSLLKSVRAGGRHAAAPAAAITAYARTEDRSAARDAGFDDHLVKPIDGTTLAMAVARLLAPGGERLPGAADVGSARRDG